MAQSDKSSSGKNENVITDVGIIEISRKTVRFGDDVYQLSNVTGFGGTEIDAGQQPLATSIMYLLGIALLAFMGVMFFINQSSQILGVVLLLLAGYLFWTGNRSKPKIYGFGLSTRQNFTRKAEN